MSRQRGGTFPLQNGQLITEVGTDRMDELETEHRYFPKGTKPGPCHLPVPRAAALSTGLHHLAPSVV